MAEGGGIEEFLGEPNVGAEAKTGVAGADAVALTVAMDATKYDPELARKAGNYLDQQHALVKLQIKHFDEEHRLSIAAAKRKRYADRIRNGLGTFLALVATGVVVGLVAMVWDAARDTELVIEPFAVPPDLAAQGLSGEVVAKQVLDRLADLQQQTASQRPANSYRNNWGDDIKVQIPETGVSLGELRRSLRDSLGHETHISGEIYHTAAGLIVTARSGDEASKRITGTDAELDQLIDRAAEAVYQQTQPYRYALYLVTHQRFAEALKIVTPLVQHPDRLERAWAHTAIGNLGVAQGAEPAFAAKEQRASLVEIPGFAPALFDLTLAANWSGHDQELVKAATEFIAADRSRHLDIAKAAQTASLAGILEWKACAEGDYPEAIRQARIMADTSKEFVQARALIGEAESAALNHDPVAARQVALQLPADHPSRSLALGLTALELGDATAVSLLDEKVLTAPRPFFPDGFFSTPALSLRHYVPWSAIARARFGDLQTARQLIARTPVDCYLCVRARGQIAAMAGDRAEAERWFAEAVKQGPGLPQAFVDRGAAHLNWGDVPGAISDAKQAAKLSPHHADAWKLWGDALSHQSQWNAALGKYDEALKYAADWAALKEAREAAAKHTT
jgi:tetratricopeptide (TPR) repeat protein